MVISLVTTDATDHVNGFHLFLASDESTYQTRPSRQAFLDFLAPFSIIRFMDWSSSEAAWVRG